MGNDTFHTIFSTIVLLYSTKGRAHEYIKYTRTAGDSSILLVYPFDDRLVPCLNNHQWGPPSPNTITRIKTFIIRGVVKNGYFTVRLTVRGEGADT